MTTMIMVATHKEVSDLRFLNASAAMERISLLLKSLKRAYKTTRPTIENDILGEDLEDYMGAF